MQTLNQNEIEAISGGILTAEKPLSEINISDTFTLLGVLGGGNLGPTLATNLVKDTVFSGPVGNIVSTVLGAALGGLLASNVGKRVLPTVLGLLG